MNTLRNLLLGATALSATGAFAADIPVRSAPVAPVMVAPVFTWTGFYVGGNVGWARTNTKIKYDYPEVLGTGPGGNEAYYFPHGFKLNDSGVTAGVQIGYNWQVSQAFVWGFELDWNWLNAKKRQTHAHGGYFNNYEIQLLPNGYDYYSELTGSTRTTWLATARLRAGFLLSPSLLFYATGGAALGNVRSSTTGYYDYDYGKGGPIYLAAPALSPNGVYYHGSSNKTRFGWAAGVGAEWAFAPNWSMKLEWLHYDLGTTHHTVGGEYTENTAGSPFQAKVRHSGDLVRVGLNFRFGGPAATGPIVARY